MTQKLIQRKVRMPIEIVKALDELVDLGFFINRNEAIREAIRQKLKEESS